MNELERRRAATEKTLARFRGKAFDWQRGITCAHLARYHLRNLGHAPPSLPRFRSLLGAKRALAARGWDSTAAMLGGLLVPIAPARMLLGDLAVLPSEDGLGSIFVNLGNGKLAGWHGAQDAMALVEVPADELTGAFRG